MEMKQLFGNSQYKVMDVALNAGEGMPLHKATSDAFVIVKEGTGKIIFADKEVELSQGTAVHIPANKVHKLQVNDKFNACVVFAAESEINFLNN